MATVGLVACGGESKTAGGGAAPPPGAGYGAGPTEDVRALSRDDCISLRDHQIEIAVAAALGAEASDSKRLEVEAKVRAQMKPETDAWLKRCSGKIVRSKDLRCMKDATTPEAFMACGESKDASDAGAASDASPSSDAGTPAK